MEENRVRFVIHGKPFGKQRPRVTCKGEFSKAYTPKETITYENLVKVEYDAQTGGYRFPDDAMLDLRILAFYEIPKSTSKKNRQKMLDGVIRPTKKPDMDNVMKVIADSLNAIAYRDDTQIVDAQCRKFYSDTPRVEVKILQITEE